MSKPSFRRARTQTALLSGRRPLVVIGVFVLALLFAVRTLAPDAFTTMLRPLHRLADGATASVGALTGADAAREQLAAENAALIVENAALAARAADLSTLLGTRTDPQAGIVASVLARPPSSPYDTLLVDQGSDDGVGFGAMVYGPGGTPVGAVTEVLRRTARVTLYSTRGSLQYGWAGEARVPVELAGTGSGGFEVTAPLEAGLAPGDGVYLVQGGALPIGVVVALDEDPSAPRTVVHVRPYMNPFSLTWVTIAPTL